MNYKCRTDATSYHDQDDLLSDKEQNRKDEIEERQLKRFFLEYDDFDDSRRYSIAEQLINEDEELRKILIALVALNVASKTIHFGIETVQEEIVRAAKRYVEDEIENNNVNWEY